jgi:hypothetical protein
VVRVILYDAIVDVRAVRPPLRPRLDVHIGHIRLPYILHELNSAVRLSNNAITTDLDFAVGEDRSAMKPPTD